MSMHFVKGVSWVLVICTLLGCSKTENNESALFEDMSSSETGISFENTLTNS
jgi:hypothetical protein